VTRIHFFAALSPANRPLKFHAQRTWILALISSALMILLMGGCISTPISNNASGPAAAAHLEFTPSSVSFASAVVGESNSQTLKVSNTGDAPVTISGITATGAGLSITGFSGSMLLNPGTNTTFGVQVTPKSAGAISGSVAIVTKTQALNTTLPVTGEAAAAKLAISVGPSSLNFGTVSLGKTLSEGVTVTNTGNTVLTVSKILISGSGFNVSGGNAPLSLASAQSATVEVEFAPSKVGAYSGTLTVDSNASNSSVVVKLAGTEVAGETSSAPHSVALSWNPSPSSSIVGYNVYRSGAATGPFSRLNGSLVNELSFTDTSVTATDTYYYVTTAVNALGEESPYSNLAKAVIP